jgi:type VI secretion system VgrG family protein
MLDRNTWMRRFTEGSTSMAGIGRDFELRLGSLADEELKVAGFFGSEALNELYSFEVIFGLGAIEGAALLSQLGQDVHLRMPFPSGMRHVLGIAAAVEIVEARPDSLVARVEIVPRLWRLGHTKNSRVYQNMTTEKIVDEVLARHRVPHRFTFKHQYPEREYCLQYDESDLAFVLRLLAEEGFSFTFEHWDETEAKKAGEKRPTECMMISDDTALYTTIQKSPPILVYQPDANHSMWALEPIVRLVQRAAMGTNMVTLRDYDFERASPTPQGQHASPGTSTAAPYIQNGSFTTVARIEAPENPVDLEYYDHRAEEGPERKDNRRAFARLGALALHTDIFHGRSWTRRLSPGKSFRLHDYTLAEEATELTVTRIQHESHPGSGGGRAEYVNEFEAVKRTILVRPPAPPRRFVQTVETATVVGTQGQDVETDVHGRIKIQFHWDRQGKNDEHSSCWVRVTQPWSGATYGFQFVPRIGSEVLVAFLSGDPDHPVVVGSLPNTANRLPQLLPQNSSRSVRAPDREIPPELDEICVRATARDRDKRYPSARALHEAIERFLDGDRNLEQRRAVASEHAVRAEQAVAAALAAQGQDAEAARRAALREVGRALALDPEKRARPRRDEPGLHRAAARDPRRGRDRADGRRARAPPPPAPRGHRRRRARPRVLAAARAVDGHARSLAVRRDGAAHARVGRLQGARGARRLGPGGGALGVPRVLVQRARGPVLRAGVGAAARDAGAARDVRVRLRVRAVAELPAGRARDGGGGAARGGAPGIRVRVAALLPVRGRRDDHPAARGDALRGVDHGVPDHLRAVHAGGPAAHGRPHPDVLARRGAARLAPVVAAPSARAGGAESRAPRRTLTPLFLSPGLPGS